MHDVLSTVTSPVFWVGTVVAGILVNIVSNFAQRPIDRVINSIVQGRKSRTEAEMQALERRANILATYPELLQFEFQRLVEALFAALIGFFGAGFSTSIASFLRVSDDKMPLWQQLTTTGALGLIVLLCIVFAVRCFNKVAQSSRLLHAARRIRYEQIRECVLSERWSGN